MLEKQGLLAAAGKKGLGLLLRLMSLPSFFGFNGVDAGGGDGWSFGAGGSGFWSDRNAGRIAVVVTAMAGIALAATFVYSRRDSLKSPWSNSRRKPAISPQLWESLFTPDGKIHDHVNFLKKVRSGGVDPSIRAKVWPFLLGVYSLNSTSAERLAIEIQKRKEYMKLRKLCQCLLKQKDDKSKELSNLQNSDSPSPEVLVSTKQFSSSEHEVAEEDELEQSDLEKSPCFKSNENQRGAIVENEDGEKSGLTNDASRVEAELSESESFEEKCDSSPELDENVVEYCNIDLLKEKSFNTTTTENFVTWQRIIRLDALRANAEWITYSPTQAAVSESQARQLAQDVGLQDYDHLEPCRIYHAARLVAILEAYAIYDSEIGYCQGMSDLLAPIVAIFEKDHEAFWCFVGFMRKARHNFRLDEVGIRRQLNIVSKIIKMKDPRLFKHLEKLQAEDCFFVYRMVVVLFRRELTFEQTLCLWEVMWADQAAIRAGLGKSEWGRIRQGVPPTDDLLLYAIAASVLQRRKLIIEKYSGMDEILRECNSMAGHLDVWKLLHDAHALVVTLHNKV